MFGKNSKIFLIDREGGGSPLDFSRLDQWSPEQGVLWLHLDYNDEQSDLWLSEESKLDSLIIDALMAEDTRPRYFSMGGGLLVILRGVNLNPGKDPEDMVSVRMWIDPARIITVVRQNIIAIDDIHNSLRSGNGPVDAGDFLVHLVHGLSTRIADVVFEINESVDELEDQAINDSSVIVKRTLSSLRRQMIRLRRYLIPQGEVFYQLQIEKLNWLSEVDKIRIRESSDKIMRYLEDMDSAKDRAAIIQEEIESRLSAQINRNMYVLSLVAAIFLPLGFVTGLFGTNVAGLPGLNNPDAFFILCGVMVGMAIVQMAVFRFLKWM